MTATITDAAAGRAAAQAAETRADAGVLPTPAHVAAFAAAASALTDELLELALNLPVTPKLAARIARASKELHLVSILLRGGTP